MRSSPAARGSARRCRTGRCPPPRAGIVSMLSELNGSYLDIVSSQVTYCMHDNKAAAAGAAKRPDLPGHCRRDRPGDRSRPAEARRPSADPARPRTAARRDADDRDARVRRSAAPRAAERRGGARHVRASQRARDRRARAGRARSRRQRADAASVHGGARRSSGRGGSALGRRARSSGISIMPARVTTAPRGRRGSAGPVSTRRSIASSSPAAASTPFCCR